MLLTKDKGDFFNQWLNLFNCGYILFGIKQNFMYFPNDAFTHEITLYLFNIVVLKPEEVIISSW